MKSLLCAKVNSDRVWAQINAVMSGALCRRQKASFYNGLLCGLPTTSTGLFLHRYEAGFFISNFVFLKWFLTRGETWFGGRSRTCMRRGRWWWGRGSGRSWYPKFMRKETYWISRQGGAKLRGSAGCVMEAASSFCVFELRGERSCYTAKTKVSLTGDLVWLLILNGT